MLHLTMINKKLRDLCYSFFNEVFSIFYEETSFLAKNEIKKSEYSLLSKTKNFENPITIFFDYNDKENIQFKLCLKDFDCLYSEDLIKESKNLFQDKKISPSGFNFDKNSSELLLNNQKINVDFDIGLDGNLVSFYFVVSIKLSENFLNVQENSNFFHDMTKKIFDFIKDQQLKEDCSDSKRLKTDEDNSDSI